MDQKFQISKDEREQCRFCKMFEELKETAEYYSQKREGRNGETINEYSVAIVHEVYYDGYYCGRSAFDAGPIHYCPGCGRSLEEDLDTKRNHFEKENEDE